MADEVIMTTNDGSTLKFDGPAELFVDGVFIGTTPDPNWPSHIYEDTLDAEEIE